MNLRDKSEIAVIVTGHGSRFPGSLEAFHDRVREVADHLPSFRVVGANLELVPPTLEEVFIGLVHEGFRNILVFPYFLLPGKHTERDIPDQCQALQARFPDVRLRLADYLGKEGRLAQTMAQQVRGLESLFLGLEP